MIMVIITSVLLREYEIMRVLVNSNDLDIVCLFLFSMFFVRIKRSVWQPNVYQNASLKFHRRKVKADVRKSCWRTSFVCRPEISSCHPSSEWTGWEGDPPVGRWHVNIRKERTENSFGSFDLEFTTQTEVAAKFWLERAPYGPAVHVWSQKNLAHRSTGEWFRKGGHSLTDRGHIKCGPEKWIALVWLLLRCLWCHPSDKSRRSNIFRILARWHELFFCLKRSLWNNRIDSVEFGGRKRQ